MPNKTLIYFKTGPISSCWAWDEQDESGKTVSSGDIEAEGWLEKISYGSDAADWEEFALLEELTLEGIHKPSQAKVVNLDGVEEGPVFPNLFISEPEKQLDEDGDFLY